MMNPICYQCGEEMIDEKDYLSNPTSFEKKPKFKHFEHIIQNALYGKLKPNNILCKDCGTKFSQDIDKGFVSIFFPITERIKDILISKDHGNNSINNLKGIVYTDEDFSEGTEVLVRKKEVTPKKPFYEFDKNKKKVTIYANKIRAKQFQPIVEKELKEKGINIQEIEFVVNTDISTKGSLGIFFTEGMENFNEKFKMGFCKIALGFASYCGIKREQLPRVLEIDEYGQGKLIYSKNLIPFVSIGAVDYMFELNRASIEEHYPSHTLILFSQQVGDKKHLYCYVDLFSTFQYYVLLNENYKGNHIYECYHQATIKKEFPLLDVRSIRPKHLNIVIKEYGIDMTKYQGNTFEEQLDFLDKEIKKVTFNPRLELKSELHNIFSKLNYNFMLSQIKQKIVINEIIKNFEHLNEQQIPAFIQEMLNYSLDSNEFNFKFFRRAFFEDDAHGDLEILSCPIECTHVTTTDLIRKAYGHIKFEQINKFINDK